MIDPSKVPCISDQSVAEVIFDTDEFLTSARAKALIFAHGPRGPGLLDLS